MKLRFLFMLFVLSLFSTQSFSQSYEKMLGEWSSEWKDIKKDYTKEVGKKSRPREALFLFIKKSSVTPSLKKLDSSYEKLENEELAGKDFRKEFKKFKKAYKEFKVKKDDYIIYMNNQLYDESKSKDEKKAIPGLVKDMNNLEKSIRRFYEKVSDEKKKILNLNLTLLHVTI